MNIEQEKAAILQLYAISVQGHLESDAFKFLIPYAQQWHSVRDGTVTIRTKDGAFPAIEHYFKHTRFLEFDDTPPRIEVSKDGSMAWLLGEVRVLAMQKQPGETERELAFRCSWIEIYEKREAGWAAVVNASTFQIPSESE